MLEEMEPTGGSHPAVRERGEERGWAGSGCCTVFGPRVGPGGLDRAVSVQILLFSFISPFFLFFSVFLILLYLLHKDFKFSQTNV
jgi:hypothetical protein